MFARCPARVSVFAIDGFPGVSAMEIKQKIWLEKNGHAVLGKGRGQLLRAIDKYQSLSAAVREVHMTYRGAWGRLKASEKNLNIKLVEPHGKGMRLTPTGRALLEAYDQLQKDMDSMLNKSSRRLKRIFESPSKTGTSK